STTNDSTPTIRGTSEPGAAISLTVGGASGSPTVDGSGDWSFTPATPIDDGVQTVTVIATDAAGNTGPTETSTFTIDTEVPSVVSIEIDGSPGPSASQVTWIVTFDEAVTG